MHLSNYKMDKFIHNKGKLVILIVVILFGIPYLVNNWKVNHFSVHFLKMFFNEESNRTYVDMPPIYHPRSFIWLSRYSLEKGDIEKAYALLNTSNLEDNAQALLLLGEVLLADGKYQEAVQVWKDSNAYYQLIQAARNFREEYRMQEALMASRAAWELSPENATNLLATIMREIGEIEDAEILLKQMIAEYPHSSQCQSWLLLLGNIYRSNKSWDSASRTYEIVLLESPENIQALIALGWINYEQGEDIDAVIYNFQHAIDIAPHRGDGYFAIGQLMAKENKYIIADSWFMKAVEHNPENRWWWLTQANNQRTAGNVTESLNLYLETTERFPEWDYVYYEISWGYRLNNQPGEAIKSIEKAISLNNRKDGYFRRAGLIYEWVGSLDKALAAYQQASSLSPLDENIRKDIERITELEN